MHRNRLPALFILVSVFLIAAACNRTSHPPPVPSTIVPGNVDTVKIADQVDVLSSNETSSRGVETVTAEGRRSERDNTCATPAAPGVAFPQQLPITGDREVMEAELIGNLVLVEGCLRVNSIYGDGSFLPVWPPGFTLRVKNNVFQILDETGQVVGRVGEEVYMGGGTGSATAMTECTRQQLPVNCPDPYWIVGDGVRPNLRYDSDLFGLEIISEPERSFFLLHQKPVLKGWLESTATITGKLVLYQPSRCLRVQSDSGLTDYLPLWPANYTARIQQDVVEILDGSAKVVARVGETVQLDGGKISVDWNSENYRRLHQELPGDCNGSYWIVGE